MGTSKSPVQFARKINELTKVPDRVASAAVKINVNNGVANAKREVAAATGGSSKLRNAGALVRAGESRKVVGVKGAKLSVSAKLNGTKAVGPTSFSGGGLSGVAVSTGPVSSGSAATGGLISAVGPWQLIEYPTKQHFIGPAGLRKTVAGAKSGRTTVKAREGRAKAVRTPFGPKRFVYVKGTKGKFPWRKAAAKTVREASLAMQKASDIEMAKVFR